MQQVIISQTLLTLFTFLEIPGPGEYLAPSEFGQYESRLKYNQSMLQ